MGNTIKYFLEDAASNIWTNLSNHEDFTTIVLHLRNFLYFKLQANVYTFQCIHI